MPDIRKAGADILRLLTSASDPGAETGRALIYAKDDGGVIKAYVLWDDGTVVEVGSGGGGGTPVAHNVLVFRPGSGQSGPVVFDDFNALYAQLETLRGTSQGIYTILLDDTDQANANISSGPGSTTYDFDSVRLVGIHPGTDVEVADDGGEGDSLHIDNALWFENLNITTGNATDTPFFANDGQTITLNRTKFTGQGEFVFDVLAKTGVRFRLNDGSQLLKGSNAALRVNNSAIVVDVVGNDTVMNTRCMVSGVGGSVDINVYSSSARVDQDQLDISVTSFNMLTASGYFNADPNTKLTAQKGVQVYDTNTGLVWRNTTGTTQWTPTPTAKTGYATIDAANTYDIVELTIPTPANGDAYAVDFMFTGPVPAAGSQGIDFSIAAGDDSIGYVGFSETGGTVGGKTWAGRIIINFGPITGTQETVVSGGYNTSAPEFTFYPDGPSNQTLPIFRSIKVSLTTDLNADTGQATIATATVAKLA